MSIFNEVVAMDLDYTGPEEPSTPLRDPTSSPVVHIQWQNSQSACAAIEELRAASSVPRRPPKPLTFDFELPVIAGPSWDTTEPSLPSRTRARSVRTRALGRVQSRSQNDVLASPATDASKFLDMVGRASARVDENSRKRMKAREFQRRTGREHVRTQKSSTKGKERICGTMFAHSMDELGGDRDHTDFVRGSHDTGLQYSSLPIMQSKNPPSQSGSALQQADKGDVDMHADAPVPGDSDDRVKPPISTHPRNGTQHVPSRSATAARHSQKRAQPPSPTPARPIPTTLRPPPAPPPKPATSPTLDPPKPTPGPPRRSALHSSSSTNTNSQHPVPVPVPVRALTPLPPAANGSPKGRKPAALRTPESLPRRGTSTSAHSTTSSTSAPQPSQGSKRALGMTRSVPRASSNAPHSAASKKPFRPPLARSARPAATMSQVPSATPSHAAKPAQQWPEDGNDAGADPDSSFDISFDFDPEALEAALKKYD